MKVTFYATGNYDVYWNGRFAANFVAMEDAVNYIDGRWNEGNNDTATICSGETGEVFMEFKDDEVDEYYPDDYYEDYEPDYDECGFNPYMGCYDFDC